MWRATRLNRQWCCRSSLNPQQNASEPFGATITLNSMNCAQSLICTPGCTSMKQIRCGWMNWKSRPSDTTPRGRVTYLFALAGRRCGHLRRSAVPPCPCQTMHRFCRRQRRRLQLRRLRFKLPCHCRGSHCSRRRRRLVLPLLLRRLPGGQKCRRRRLLLRPILLLQQLRLLLRLARCYLLLCRRRSAAAASTPVIVTAAATSATAAAGKDITIPAHTTHLQHPTSTFLRLCSTRPDF